VLACEDEGARIGVRIGCFFSEIVGGCSCGDDPVPAQAYCDLKIMIDKATGETEIAPMAD